MDTVVLVVACVALAVSVGAGDDERRRPQLSPQAATLYVSKLGDNSDGSSWERALHTIQAALDAIPDDRGGYRILVRPDTYFEANLAPAHRGAQERYNELIGDFDGRYGSGTTGWVVIDSSDPGQKGFKGYDWWQPIRAYSHGWSAEHTDPTSSAIGWDRWRLQGLYVTGGDAGTFFDCTDRVEPFTVVVEDCVGIGRAFGGGVASCLSRPDEPILFRRCWLWSLDWWGDASGGYVRVENQHTPDRPDVIFEDCVLVGPECALKVGNYGFHTHSYISLRRCRLVTLNFSQPHGTPSDGIVQSVQEGKCLRVDLEDCTLMGYKVFGVKVEKGTVGDIQYATRGDCRAYVQFQQDVPEGFHRLGAWPVELFQSITPPAAKRPSLFVERQLVARDVCELSPFVWRGRLCHMECVRPASGGTRADYYLLFRDAETGHVIGRAAEGYGLASIIVHDETAYVFASRWEGGGWHDVTLFKSRDLRRWESKVVLQGENEQIFNTSVCKGRDRFVMAYESNDPAWPPFTIKFATSRDLENWEKRPDSTLGTNRYTACPCIRYVGGYYYVLYLERRTPRWQFETYVVRSKDLEHWEQSASNPVIVPEGIDEGVNASDPEIVEWQGRTYLYYAVSDQLTWANVKRAVFPWAMRRFFEHWFQAGAVPEWGCAALEATRKTSAKTPGG